MAERDPSVAPGRNRLAYEADYAAWISHQVELLKADRWSEVDKENLIDEVESLGRSDFKSFVSAIEIVIAHMLKWDYQPARRGPSWIGSIDEHRARIEQELADSPSYKARIEEAMRRAYRPARAIASRETGLDVGSLPRECPYSWNDVVDREHGLG